MPDFYTFRAAQQLTGPQVMPILLKSPDSTVVRLALRAKRRYWLPTPLILGSYALLLGTARASRNQTYPTALGSSLLLGSVAMLTAGLVAGFTAPAQMRRTVKQYNQLVISPVGGYARPIRRLVNDDFLLTKADSLQVRRTFWGTRYTYRGINLFPDTQLKMAMQSLRDPQINEGLRQNRVLRSVGGFIGGFSAGVLVSRLLTNLLLQAAGQRVSGRRNTLSYIAVGGLAVSFTIGRITNTTTGQMVERYNDRLAGL